MDLDEAGLTHITKRNRNLVRAVNVRRGLTRKDECIPEDHYKKRFPELEEKLLDAYYEFKGWNKEGIPTRESLHELSLDYVADDFLRRGILTDNGATPAKESSAETEKK
jgi:aldehyde:ferredoxin oxidoreductase